MTRMLALRLALAALTGLALVGCGNSSAPASQASDQPAPIQFSVPKDVEQRAQQREQAAHNGAAQASSTQPVAGELGDMYKKAQQTEQAPAAH